MLTRDPHTPAHLLLDNTPYFITGAIYQKRPLLRQPHLKEALIELFHKHFDKYQWELHHWVVLDNHHHLIGQSRYGKDLPNIIRNIHSASAPIISQETACEKPIW